MKSVIISSSLLLSVRGTALAISVIVFTVGTIACPPVLAQDTTPPPSPGDNVRFGYDIHQSVDFGGHIVNQSGSGAMYDTLVNIQSGPRLLDSSFQMTAVNPAHALLFDRLSSHSFGYGGDPIDGTFMNVSKGRIYNFQGSFRRDRQYFDYNLLANPLIPPNSVPFVPVLDSPHLYNTVRRMTDVDVTVAPLSRVSGRFGYFQNINQGPSGSSIHVGADALLLQNWRVSTEVWNVGADWKPLAHTSLSFDEFITRYKGNTSWQLAGLNYKLSNGTPVSLGINLSSVWAAPCAAPFNPNGSVNPTCSGYLSYTRSAPTRTLLPSEQFRFQSTSIPHVAMNGRFMYMGTTSHLNNYYENFNGLDSRARNRVELVTGSASARRINVNADYAITWQITPTIGVSDTFNFWYFRQPASLNLTETDYAGTSMLNPPGAATTTTTTSPPFTGFGFTEVNQKTKVNTFIAIWDLAPSARLSAGYRYSSRIITDVGGDFIPIHADTALVGLVLRPTTLWRLNFNAELMSADNAFTRISPRKLQHYRVRSSYKPYPWLSFAGTINILTSSDNVQTVNHFAHNQDFSFATVISPSEKWGIDLNYAYDNVYSRTDECYTSSAPTANAQTSPPVCQDAGLPLQSNGLYNQPTQYGSIGFLLNPVKKLHAAAGYRMSSVSGTAPPINVRQVPGSLQSQYQTPYGRFAYDFTPNWTWKGEYNYYGYGEGSPVGPTLPRSFHGNVVTLAIRYAF
ncbi:outer membrane protein [Tunturiibacter gelidiferens]|uniref:outer membrane protein n=1 Tax=Tunturiibacter gelidiferens TaxID=3069689 RepID=UPI003D9AC1C4